MYDFQVLLHNRESRLLVALNLSVRPAVRSTTNISAVPTGKTVKFGIVIFYENLSRNYILGYNHAESLALHVKI
jgi:hypothetical protein